MDILKNLDLGSTLLSIAIAFGLIAFFILIVRTLLIGISYITENIKQASQTTDEDILKERKKGF